MAANQASAMPIRHARSQVPCAAGRDGNAPRIAMHTATICPQPGALFIGMLLSSGDIVVEGPPEGGHYGKASEGGHYGIVPAQGDFMTRMTASLAFTLLAGLFAAGAQAQSPAPATATTARPYFVEQSMNVFRRFSGDGTKTLEFYGPVLGFGDSRAVGGISIYQVCLLYP